jgi:hypothetical protein
MTTEQISQLKDLYNTMINEAVENIERTIADKSSITDVNEYRNRIMMYSNWEMEAREKLAALLKEEKAQSNMHTIFAEILKPFGIR